MSRFTIYAWFLGVPEARGGVAAPLHGLLTRPLFWPRPLDQGFRAAEPSSPDSWCCAAPFVDNHEGDDRAKGGHAREYEVALTPALLSQLCHRTGWERARLEPPTPAPATAGAFVQDACIGVLLPGVLAEG